MFKEERTTGLEPLNRNIFQKCAFYTQTSQAHGQKRTVKGIGEREIKRTRECIVT
jgi:hypothetical protein